MAGVSRRHFLRFAGSALAATTVGRYVKLLAQEPGERPERDPTVRVANPRCRVPVSLIIDDSTCLVNMAHFAMPQFGAVWPDRDEYKKPWWKLPREIPDSFVRRFVDWCAEHGVKGKYTVVPNPACVGWLDCDLPGWAHRQLIESIRVVQEHVTPHFDIHPEMITHTWVIDLKTGRPRCEPVPANIENSPLSVGHTVPVLAEYMSYALRILKNIDLYCEGITTPGGFGSRALPELAQATLEACRAVFSVEIPHYFRHLFTDERSVAPRVEYASGLKSDDPRCVVSIIGCTGDWFGGWDGLTPGNADRFITPDLARGRMVEVIRRGEPAIMVCHWPGIYFNGEEVGFNILKEVVKRLHRRYDNLIWMKLSEIARYWAARELTATKRDGNCIEFNAPFACPGFTVEVDVGRTVRPRSVSVEVGSDRKALARCARRLELQSGGYHFEQGVLTACFDLPKGLCRLRVEPV